VAVTDGRDQAGLGRWRRLVRRIDDLIDSLALDIEDSWPYVVAWTAGGAVVVVGLCRLILVVTIDAHPAVAVTGVAVIAVAWLACVCALVWVYWRSRLGANAAKPFLVALAVSVVAVGVSVEMFSGATTLLWRHDLVAGAPGVDPGLWRSEQYHLWHLVGSIPLLGIPEGVHWEQPSLFGDTFGRALLLAFKLLLVVPLIRISISAYISISRWIMEAARRREELITRGVIHSSFRPDQYSDRRAGWWALVLLWCTILPALPVLAVLLMPLVFEPGGLLDGWIVRLVGDGSLALLRTAPQWLAVVLLAVLLAETVGEIWDRRYPIRDGTELSITLALSLFGIGMAVVAIAALNVTLLNVGVASMQPAALPGGHVSATLAAYGWHLTDALPGPGVPETLGWTLRHDFTDRWSALLLLLTKLYMFSLLIFAVVQAVRSFAHYARPRRLTPATLDAAAEFAAAFRQARAAVDRETEVRLAAARRRSTDLRLRFERAGGRLPGVRPGDSAGTAPPDADADVEPPAPADPLGSVSDVIDKLDRVAALFGTGEVLSRADATAAALRGRLDEVKALWTGFRLEEHERTLRAMRDEEERLFEAYRTAAETALRGAQPATAPP
jgi:hypothetical protein